MKKSKLFCITLLFTLFMGKNSNSSEWVWYDYLNPSNYIKAYRSYKIKRQIKEIDEQLATIELRAMKRQVYEMKRQANEMQKQLFNLIEIEKKQYKNDIKLLDSISTKNELDEKKIEFQTKIALTHINSFTQENFSQKKSEVIKILKSAVKDIENYQVQQDHDSPETTIEI